MILDLLNKFSAIVFLVPWWWLELNGRYRSVPIDGGVETTVGRSMRTSRKASFPPDSFSVACFMEGWMEFFYFIFIFISHLRNGPTYWVFSWRLLLPLHVMLCIPFHISYTFVLSNGRNYPIIEPCLSYDLEIVSKYDWE